MMSLDAAAHRLAAGQHGVVTRDQLLAVGLSVLAIERRCRAGLLVRCQPCVFTVAGAGQTYEQRVLAACWSAGPEAVASHRSAARLWRLRGSATDRVEILLPGSRVARCHKAVVHRTGLLEPVDRAVRDGIPVTRPERTLIDAAAVVRPDTAASMLEGAVHDGLTTLDRIWSYLSRYGGPGVRGSGVIRRVLLARGDAGGPTESGLEDLAVAILRRHGLGPLVRQHPVRGPDGRLVRIDLSDPEAMLAVEVDSARWHSDTVRYRADRAKWNLLTTLGWTLLIATEFDLHERPDAFAADVAALRSRSVRVA